jgi:hypothetical protein
MSSLDLIRSELEIRLTRCFARGEMPTVTGLSENHHFNHVKERLGVMASEGKLTWQPAPGGMGQVPHVVNLSALPLDAGTAADVLAPYLSDPRHGAADRRHMRTFMRTVTTAPRQCSDEALFSYARQIPAADLFALPDRVSEATAHLKPQTRRNLRSFALKLRAYAAEERLVPMVFPRHFAQDAWEGMRAQAWPGIEGAAPGTKRYSGAERRSRADWTVCRDVCFEILGEGATDPALLTEEQLDHVKRELKRTGRFGLVPRLRGPFQHIARLLGVGPLANSFTDATYLHHPSGASVKTIDGVLEAMGLLGFSDAWLEAMRFHHDCSVLSDAELRQHRRRFPAKRIRRHVKKTTYAGILTDLRGVLGVAIKRLGMNPATVHPEEVFGIELPQVLDEVELWWKEKCDRGEVSAAKTSMLASMLRSAAGFAYVLWARRRHERRIALRGDQQSQKLRERRAEGAVAMDPLEDELYFAYETASGMADVVDKALSNSPRGAGRNTRKDIRRVVEQTPIGYWQATLQLMLTQVQLKRAKGERSRAYCMLVQAAYRLAWLICTGMRWQELHHVRLDLQYNADQRRRHRCSLRPIDRKNQEAHDVGVDVAFLPAWLESEWLHVCRPILVGDHDHPWLFVTSGGHPIGCAEEGVDGSGRDDVTYENRLSGARSAWQAELGPWAYKANGYCPTEEGYFTPHCVRNAVGAELYSRFGVQRAADYLGDDPTIVRGHYGFLSGATSRVGELVGREDREGNLKI